MKFNELLLSFRDASGSGGSDAELTPMFLNSKVVILDHFSKRIGIEIKKVSFRDGVFYIELVT